MTRDELARKILTAKRAKGLTWKAIVAEIGGDLPSIWPPLCWAR